MRIIILLLFICLMMGCTTNVGGIENTKTQSITDTPIVHEEKSESASRHDLPTWYLIPPSDDNLIYSVGYGKMSNMQNSLKMAEMDARGDMTRKIDGIYHNLLESVSESYSRKERTAEGEEININSLVQSLSSYGSFQSSSYLIGTKRVDVYIDKEGGCYVLMSMPVGNAHAWFSEILESIGIPSDVSGDLENMFSNMLDVSI